MPSFLIGNELTDHCIKCGNNQPEGNTHHIGKGMWHWMRWTCGHETTVVCNECYNIKPLDLKCTKCGRMDSLT